MFNGGNRGMRDLGADNTQGRGFSSFWKILLSVGNKGPGRSWHKTVAKETTTVEFPPESRWMGIDKLGVILSSWKSMLSLCPGKLHWPHILLHCSTKWFGEGRMCMRNKPTIIQFKYCNRFRAFNENFFDQLQWSWKNHCMARNYEADADIK